MGITVDAVFASDRVHQIGAERIDSTVPQKAVFCGVAARCHTPDVP